MDLNENERKILKKVILPPEPPVEEMNEAQLGAYLEGRLSGAEALAVQKALAASPAWLGVVQTYRALGGQPAKGWKEPSAAALQRALEIVPRTERKSAPLMEVVLQFVEGALKVVRETADSFKYFAPAYAGVRSTEAAADQASLAWFSKEMSGLTAEVEFERTDRNQGEVIVRAREGAAGAVLRDIRVSLYMEGREVESQMIATGEAVFSGLMPGDYRLEMTRNQETLGQIALQVRGEPQ